MFEDKFIGAGSYVFLGLQGEAFFCLEIIVGKFFIVDFFDVSVFGSDFCYYFLNWVFFVQNVWDYLVDICVYDWGLVVDLEYLCFVVRVGFVLMFIIQNGFDFEWDISYVGSVMVEGEGCWQLCGWYGSVKFLFWVNWVCMGCYVDVFVVVALGSLLSVVEVEKVGTRKMGIGLFVDQQFVSDI